MSTEQRARVVAEALTWLKTPYHHRGRIKGAGVDCAMLLCEVYEAAGVTPHIDPGPYSPDWHLHHSDEVFLGWLQRYGREVDEPRPGDAILWKYGRCFSHGAILCDNEHVAHSYIGQGVRLERRDASVFNSPNGGPRTVKYFSLWDD